VIQVDSRHSEQYVNEWLNSLVLPQCELWAEQKQEFFKIRARAEIDRGIAEVTAEISLKREPSFEDGLSDRCVIPIQVPIVTYIFVEVNVRISAEDFRTRGVLRLSYDG